MSSTQTGTLRPLRPVRPLLPLLLLLVGCDGASEPALGVASSAEFVDAARLALADAREEGFGRGLDTVMLSEGSNSAAPALRVAERLVATPGMAAVVGHSNSAASLAASQVYNDHQIVQLAPTASASVYSEAGPFSFRLVPPDEKQGRFLARMLRDSVPAGGRLALFYVNDDYGRGLRASLLAAMDTVAQPYEVVLDMPHTEDMPLESGMRDHLIEALVRSEAHAILWLGRMSPLNSVLPGIRHAFGDIPIFGADAVASATAEHAGEPHWRGVRYVDFTDLEATDAARRFVDRYRERFGQTPAGPEALTYDATRLLLSAFEDGATTGPEVRDYLHSLGRERPPYPGVTGPIRFDERGNVDRDYHLGQVRAPVPDP